MHSNAVKARVGSSSEGAAHLDDVAGSDQDGGGVDGGPGLGSKGGEHILDAMLKLLGPLAEGGLRFPGVAPGPRPLRHPAWSPA